jgi:hypothetical protein
MYLIFERSKAKGEQSETLSEYIEVILTFGFTKASFQKLTK